MPMTGNVSSSALVCAPRLTFSATTAAAALPLRVGLLAFFSFLALFVAASAAHAHGGGLNKDGCHHERKTGGYHCH